MARNSSHEINLSEDAPGTDRMTRELLSVFRERFAESPGGDSTRVTVARAPGRVNLMGDHTDYNDGFVLPTTIHRAVYAALRPRPDQKIRLHSLNFEECVEYALSDPPFSSLPAWARYAAGVTAEVCKHKGIPAGFDGVLYGNVPLGSGLSSSAALEVVVALALDAAFSLNLDPVETATLCQTVEHKYVGVQCGIMDQMAVRVGQRGHALALDCRSLEYEHVPLPMEDAHIVIADSRVSRELASSKYNERRAECEEAVSFFHQVDDHVEALRDVSPALFEAHKAQLHEPIRSRARHVITENRRVQEGAQQLRHGHLESFGQLMNTSHRSLRDDYEVSSPELNALVEEAQTVEGVLGARMTGAGFGGCIVCLVEKGAVPTLRDHLAHRYTQQFGQKPALYVVKQNLEATALPA